MMINSVLDAMGKTPLVRLKKMSSGNVFGKAEFLNPGEASRTGWRNTLLNRLKKRGNLSRG